MHERHGVWSLEAAELLRLHDLVRGVGNRGRARLDELRAWYDDLSPAQRYALACALCELAYRGGVDAAAYRQALQAAGLPADHPTVRHLALFGPDGPADLADVFLRLCHLEEPDFSVAFRLLALLFRATDVAAGGERAAPGSADEPREDVIGRVVHMPLEEWLTTPDHGLMLDFLRLNNASKRKVLLFLCACCRGVWSLFTDPRSRRAVEAVELYLDGAVGAAEVEAAAAAACRAVLDSDQPQGLSLMASRVAHRLTLQSPWGVAVEVAADLFHTSWRLERFRLTKTWSGARCRRVFDVTNYLRDLFGPAPFGPAGRGPAWRPSGEGLVVRMARAIDRERDYASMPILADALEETGCTDPAILRHCRREEGHVRGCWLIDWLLDRGEAEEATG
jgi:hypothetical protein